MRLPTTLVILTLLTTQSLGQNIEVTVRVVDKVTNEPIKNANVVVFSTTRGTVTNFLGFFKLTLQPQERELVISHVTYRTEEITVPEGITSFTVPLEKMTYVLSELDLHLYPNNFSKDDLKPKKILRQVLPDSIIVIEKFADFPYAGGIESFAALFGNEFQFPKKELLEKAEGSLLLGFTIDKDGNYKDVGCLVEATNSLCSEFIRIVSKMPKWTPGQQRGEPMEQTCHDNLLWAK